MAVCFCRFIDSRSPHTHPWTSQIWQDRRTVVHSWWSGHHWVTTEKRLQIWIINKWNPNFSSLQFLQCLIHVTPTKSRSPWIVEHCAQLQFHPAAAPPWFLNPQFHDQILRFENFFEKFKIVDFKLLKKIQSNVSRVKVSPHAKIQLFLSTFKKLMAEKPYHPTSSHFFGAVLGFCQGTSQ